MSSKVWFGNNLYSPLFCFRQLKGLSRCNSLPFICRSFCLLYFMLKFIFIILYTKDEQSYRIKFNIPSVCIIKSDILVYTVINLKINFLFLYVGKVFVLLHKLYSFIQNNVLIYFVLTVLFQHYYMNDRFFRLRRQIYII